jgi:hypothetical protein
MVYAIKALRNVRVQDELGFFADTTKDCFNRVMGRTSWTESEGISLEFGFPFWLKYQFY